MLETLVLSASAGGTKKSENNIGLWLPRDNLAMVAKKKIDRDRDNVVEGRDLKVGRSTQHDSCRLGDAGVIPSVASDTPANRALGSFRELCRILSSRKPYTNKSCACCCFLAHCTAF